MRDVRKSLLPSGNVESVEPVSAGAAFSALGALVVTGTAVGTLAVRFVIEDNGAGTSEADAGSYTGMPPARTYRQQIDRPIEVKSDWTKLDVHMQASADDRATC